MINYFVEYKNWTGEPRLLMSLSSSEEADRKCILEQFWAERLFIDA